MERPILAQGIASVLRYLPLVSMFLFLTIGIGLRAAQHRQRHGTWGIWLFRAGSRTQRLCDGAFVLSVTLAAVQAVIRASSPRLLAGMLLLPRDGIATPFLAGIGSALMLAATALMVVAQWQLGTSWRIGVEDGARPGLITRGLFRYSRNPIFTSVLLALTGYVLLLPTWISLIAWLGTLFGVRTQVAAEEAYLLRTYGDAYRDYASRVGRFLTITPIRG